MNKLDIFRTESSCALAGNASAVCTVHSVALSRRALNADYYLVFPNLRRAFSHYSTSENGVSQLNIYYGDKELVFDEHDLFSFGEQLIRAGRFLAGSAMNRGEGYEWPRVSE